MKRLKTLVKRIDKIDESNFIKWLFLQREFKELIVRLNTDEQLYNRGIDSMGRELGNYSTYTLLIKMDKGQRFDHVTLNDTGRFYNSFKIGKTVEGFKITAQTLKEDNDLIQVWGEDILGLTDESLEILIELCRTILLKQMREYLIAA